jgi:hypothetical protein
LTTYSKKVSKLDKYPVEGPWPALKAVTLLKKEEEDALVKFLKIEFLFLIFNTQCVRKINN